MVDDIFVFSVKNPSDAFFDIIGIHLTTLDDANFMPIVEDTVNSYDHTPFKIIVVVKNMGEIEATKDVVVYKDEVEAERKPITLTGGAIESIEMGTLMGLGYGIPDGSQQDFTVKSE